MRKGLILQEFTILICLKQGKPIPSIIVKTCKPKLLTLL